MFTLKHKTQTHSRTHVTVIAVELRCSRTCNYVDCRAIFESFRGRDDVFVALTRHWTCVDAQVYIYIYKYIVLLHNWLVCPIDASFLCMFARAIDRSHSAATFSDNPFSIILHRIWINSNNFSVYKSIRRMAVKNGLRISSSVFNVSRIVEPHY